MLQNIIYDKPIGFPLETILTKSGMRQCYLLYSFLFNIVLKALIVPLRSEEIKNRSKYYYCRWYKSVPKRSQKLCLKILRNEQIE